MCERLFRRTSLDRVRFAEVPARPGSPFPYDSRPHSRPVIPDALFDKIRRLEVRTRGQVENIFGGVTRGLGHA